MSLKFISPSKSTTRIWCYIIYSKFYFIVWCIHYIIINIRVSIFSLSYSIKNNFIFWHKKKTGLYSSSSFSIKNNIIKSIIKVIKNICFKIRSIKHSSQKCSHSIWCNLKCHQKRNRYSKSKESNVLYIFFHIFLYFRLF